MSAPTHPPLSNADPLAPVRYLDVVLVVLAAPFVVLLDLPLLGYVVGACAWIAQRILEVVLDRAGRRSDAKRELALRFMSMIARIWLLGIAIVVVGVAGEREDGFTAAVLCLVAYTVHLATALILRPLDRGAKHP
jgi:hypothetical protein